MWPVALQDSVFGFLDFANQDQRVVDDLRPAFGELDRPSRPSDAFHMLIH